MAEASTARVLPTQTGRQVRKPEAAVESGKMRATIVLLTGNHLCHNPRAMKEAASLSRAGCNVCILGAWTDAKLKAQDQALMTSMPFRFVPALDTTTDSTRRLIAQVKGKLARIAHRIGHENS